MPEPTAGTPRRRRLGADTWPYLLAPLIPAAVVIELLDVSAVVVLFTSAVALIPPAAMMGRATEELAERSGNVIGSLLNVTFGNAPELIIALFALEKGLHEVVKASLIGSILGNILLVMGAAMLVGGLSGHRTHGVQKFGQTAASVQSTMLLLATAALIMPGVFALVQGVSLPLPGDQRVHYGSDIEQLSFAVACVLILSKGLEQVGTPQRQELARFEGTHCGVARSVGQECCFPKNRSSLERRQLPRLSTFFLHHNLYLTTPQQVALLAVLALPDDGGPRGDRFRFKTGGQLAQARPV